MMKTQTVRLEVLKKEELRYGEMKEVEAGGYKFNLARVGDRYFASEARCPHMGGKLADGKLEGTIVTCPVHGSQFDLADGRNIRWTNWSGAMLALTKIMKKPRNLRTYPVVIEQDTLFIEV
jgi:3-phenylpropionate/trans-cinnamate dioxygenase ferredoxin component